MLGMSRPRAMRATACTRIASRRVGPWRERPRRAIGASAATKGRGTNSVKPPVSRCKRRSASRCSAQSLGGIHVPEHHGRGTAQAQAVRRAHHLKPLASAELVGADALANPRNEYLRGRARPHTAQGHHTALRLGNHFLGDERDGVVTGAQQSAAVADNHRRQVVTGAYFRQPARYRYRTRAHRRQWDHPFAGGRRPRSVKHSPRARPRRAPSARSVPRCPGREAAPWRPSAAPGAR